MDIELNLIKSGRESSSVLVVIPAVSISVDDAKTLLAKIPESFEAYAVTGTLPRADSVMEFAKQLDDLFAQSGVRRATIMGIGSGASIAQALAIIGSKAVRKIVLVDPLTRFEPTYIQRVIDRVERIFPLGLPLRKLTKDFDSRSMLHRIHCPTLVVFSSGAGGFVAGQADLIAHRIPNVWLSKIKTSIYDRDGGLIAELVAMVEEFLQVAAKRPQKAQGRKPRAQHQANAA